MSRKVIVVLAVLVLLLIVGATLYVASIKPGHRTLIVPDDYATIGWALGNATAGDTVYVRSGTYNERSFVIDKPLTLIGEDYSNTILIGGFEGIRGGGSTISIRADNVTVSGFTIKSYSFPTPAWYFFGIYAGGNNSKVTGNIIENCAVGIWNDGSAANISSTTISDNLIRENLYTGILIGGSSSFITIENNNVTANSVGISLANGYRCTITRNRISLNTNGGIGLSGARIDTIGNILTYNNESSIKFYGSSDLCRIWNNTIENCQVGVDLSAGSRYSVGGNNISNCAAYAIGFYQTSTSYIFENNITDNTIGISFSQREDATPMNYSSFYRNNLINNGQHIFIGVSGSINNWDSNGLGNYWSDYTTKYPDAAEMNNTGIWNTPYVIDANNEDRNPLVNPYNT
jgi:nitrous oxidase accessory protein